MIVISKYFCDIHGTMLCAACDEFSLFTLPAGGDILVGDTLHCVFGSYSSATYQWQTVAGFGSQSGQHGEYFTVNSRGRYELNCMALTYLENKSQSCSSQLNVVGTTYDTR
jgi:hypothetical protein